MTKIAPESVTELTDRLARAHADRAPVGRPDLRHVNRLLAHVPEDMTVSVEAGMTLAALQARLAAEGQWIPIDPPHPETLTIGDLLSFDRSGPRRYAYGSIRDHVIGLRVALADGRLVKSGGQVVKNVAGFDLLKLFIGDHGSLGVIVEVTFKLLPKPKAMAGFEFLCRDLSDAEAILIQLGNSPATPVAVDLYHVPAEPNIHLRVLVEGTSDEVSWQDAELRRIGFHSAGPADREGQFWAKHPVSSVRVASVLPSKLTERLGQHMHQDFIARAGSGIIYCPPANDSAPRINPPDALSLRVKESFDPHRILPELPA